MPVDPKNISVANGRPVEFNPAKYGVNAPVKVSQASACPMTDIFKWSRRFSEEEPRRSASSLTYFFCGMVSILSELHATFPARHTPWNTPQAHCWVSRSAVSS